MPALPISVSAYTTLYSAADCNTILPIDSAHAYRDGNEARLRIGPGRYLTVAAVGNGNAHGVNSRYVMTNTSLPAGPAGDATGRLMNVAVGSVPSKYHYCGLCSLLPIPADGSILATVHLEQPSPDTTYNFGTLGLARSTDQGFTWTFLGEVITPGYTYNTPADGSFIEIGGAPAAFVGNWLYVWFKETHSDQTEGWAVARTDAAAAYAAAVAGTITAWNKWDGTAWGAAGLGGAGAYLMGPTIPYGSSGWDTQLFFPNFADVCYHRTARLFLAANYGKTSYLVWSTDGIRWSTTHIALTDEISNRLVYMTLWPVAYADSRSGAGRVLGTYVWNSSGGGYEVRQRVITIKGGSGRTHASRFRCGPLSLSQR